MLANDSNEGKNQSEFFLVIRPHQAVAELMAECPKCSAITRRSGRFLILLSGQKQRVNDFGSSAFRRVARCRSDRSARM